MNSFTSPLMPAYARQPVCFARGSGARLWDDQGHEWVGIEMKQPATHLAGRALAEQRLLISVTRDTTIRLLPPLICDAAQVDEIVARITRLLATEAANAVDGDYACALQTASS